MASGINTTFRQVGTATGVAALGSIFAAQAGFVDGLNVVLLVGAVTAFVAGGLTLFLVRERDLVREEEQDGTAPAVEPDATPMVA